MDAASAPAYLNGAFTTVGECRVSILDRGLLFGDAVYEVVPVYGGTMFEWPAHFERLKTSLRETGIASSHSSQEWEAILGELIRLAGDSDMSLYLQVSRGVAPRNHVPDATMMPTVLAMAMPSPPETFGHGVSAVIAEDERWRRCDIKVTSLAANVLHRLRAVESGAHDAILVRGGLVTESSAANVFVVKDGALATPLKDWRILAGITRGVLLRLAVEHGVEANERDVAVEELKTADEIWLSSSTKEILPVTRLDGRAVGSGEPGFVWRAFREHLKALK